MPITIEDKTLLPKTGDKAVERERIQVIYDEAYKAGGQAQKSADEISGALRNALPRGVNSLGNIGEAISDGLAVSSFKGAKLQLNVFASAIFYDPSCKGLYSQDEQAAVKELVIGKALEYCEKAGIGIKDAMQLIRDNLIKIHHHQTVDHRVISGSDHGCKNVAAQLGGQLLDTTMEEVSDKAAANADGFPLRWRP